MSTICDNISRGEDGVLRNVISDETMEYVGILAKLELTKEEAEAAKKDMEEMLDYIDQLNEVGVDTYPADVENYKKDNSESVIESTEEDKDGE